MKDPKEIKSKCLRIRVSPNDEAQLQEFIKLYHSTISGVIRIAIEEFIENHKNKQL